LSLSSTPADLSNLAVGQSVTVEVTLNVGDSPTGDLGLLAATVQWNGALLGTPVISDGPIVDPTGVLKTEGLGIADYLYDNLFAISGNPISVDGLFFSFTVTALAAGSGMLEFSFVGGDDTNFNPVNILASSGLPFSIASATPSTPVPEPASWLVWFIIAGVLALPLEVARRSRRRARCQVGRSG